MEMSEIDVVELRTVSAIRRDRSMSMYGSVGTSIYDVCDGASVASLDDNALVRIDAGGYADRFDVPDTSTTIAMCVWICVGVFVVPTVVE